MLQDGGVTQALTADEQSGGLVIGPAVAGGVIAVLILAALIYCLHKRGRSETILASNSGLKS